MGEPQRRVHMAAGEAYDLDGHVKTQCTLYLSHASFSSPPICVCLLPSLFLCGFSPSAFLSSTPSLFLALPTSPPPCHSLCFSAASSTYYALFSPSVKAAWPPNVLLLLSASPPLYLSLFLLHKCACSRTHLSMEIEIMIMYPSVCIKVLPLQKNPGGHEMQT